MNVSVHHRIKILIEETNDAFSTSGAMNADYAEFATLALSEFKHVLRNPKLTRAQLTHMLRTGMTKHRAVANPESCWATFMANYIARTANSSDRMNPPQVTWEEIQEEKA